MTCFADYARYYNLLYRDKDYAGEVQFVHQLIQRYRPGAKTILNLGCGTGRHDFEFARLGYTVTGIDISPEMLEVAGKRLAAYNDQNTNLMFIEDDIRTARLHKKFDVVVSLFHVMGYQATNDDLQAAFTTAKTHLESGGLFLFDCWYGPAVLTDLPAVRIKRLADDDIEVLRIAEPAMRYNENIVMVHYLVLIIDRLTGAVQRIAETHRMRYLFMPEVVHHLQMQRMCTIKAEEWLTGNEPSPNTWSVLFCAELRG